MEMEDEEEKSPKRARTDEGKSRPFEIVTDVVDSDRKSTGENNTVETSASEEIGTRSYDFLLSKFGDQKPHPLLMEHVLDKVFKYVIGTPEVKSVEGLAQIAASNNMQNFRLVCNLWNERATILYQEIVPLRRFENNINYPKPHFKLDTEFPEFLNVMENSSIIPVQRYAFNACLFSQFAKESKQMLKDFIRICAPTTVELQLYADNVSNFYLEEQTDLNFGGHFEKLKSLLVKVHEDCFDCFLPTEDERIFGVLEQLLDAAPNLHEFSFETPADVIWRNTRIRHRCTEAEKIFAGVIKRLPEGLKVLRLTTKLLSDLELHALTETNLAVEEAEFGFYEGQCRDESIRMFFEKQKESLLSLKLTGEMSPTTEQYPQMEKVLSLNLALLEFGFIEFSIPDTFPNLTSLDLRNWPIDPIDETDWCMEKVQSVVELFLPSGFPYRDSSYISDVPKCFPNVKNLWISPCSPRFVKSMEAVFEDFTEIEELVIELCLNPNANTKVDMNTVLSGVTIEDRQKIVLQGKDKFAEVNLSDVQRKPSILNLTNLRKLKIDVIGDIGGGGGSSGSLTYFTTYFIFERMANLEELHAPDFKMSAESIKFLENKLKVMRLRKG